MFRRFKSLFLISTHTWNSINSVNGRANETDAPIRLMCVSEMDGYEKWKRNSKYTILLHRSHRKYYRNTHKQITTLSRLNELKHAQTHIICVDVIVLYSISSFLSALCGVEWCVSFFSWLFVFFVTVLSIPLAYTHTYTQTSNFAHSYRNIPLDRRTKSVQYKCTLRISTVVRSWCNHLKCRVQANIWSHSMSTWMVNTARLSNGTALIFHSAQLFHSFIPCTPFNVLPCIWLY